MLESLSRLLSRAAQAEGPGLTENKSSVTSSVQKNSGGGGRWMGLGIENVCDRTCRASIRRVQDKELKV